MPTIACAMIVRDAEKTLGKALASIVPYVDQVVVVDTGSVDGTEGIAINATGLVYHFDWCDDFAKARQYAHNLCDADWVFFLDADDEVFGAEYLRQAIEDAPDERGAYMIRYVTERDDRGTPIMQFWRERLTRQGAFHWEGRIHEIMVPNAPTQMERLETTWVLHHGHGDGTASMERNIRILRQVIAEEPNKPRPLFYLGRDLVLQGAIDEGREILERYIDISDWVDEQYVAQSMIAHCHRLKGNYLRAYQEDLQLLTIYPRWPQTWFTLAQDAYFLQNWEWSVFFSEIGQSLPAPESTLFQSPRALESDWMIFQTVSLFHNGQLPQAAELTLRALQLRPDDPQHRHNAAFFATQLQQVLGPEPVTVDG